MTWNHVGARKEVTSKDAAWFEWDLIRRAMAEVQHAALSGCGTRLLLVVQLEILARAMQTQHMHCVHHDSHQTCMSHLHIDQSMTQK